MMIRILDRLPPAAIATIVCLGALSGSSFISAAESPDDFVPPTVEAQNARMLSRPAGPRGVPTPSAARRTASNSTDSSLSGSPAESMRQNPDLNATRRRVDRLTNQLKQLERKLAVPALPSSKSDPATSETTPPAETQPYRETQPPVAESHPAPSPVAPVPKPVGSGKVIGLIKDLPTEPLDRLAVADNLFAAGETILAADIYKSIKGAKLPRDEMNWIEFQMANCDRRLGRIDDARKRYRKLVGDPSTGRIQDLSKWWLDALDRQESLKKELVAVKALVEQARKVSEDAHRKPE